MSSRFAGKGVCACFFAGFQHPASAVAPLKSVATEMFMRTYGVLAACVTTVEDLESRPARATYELQRSPESFIQCILETMGNLGSPNHYERAEGAKVISYTV